VGERESGIHEYDIVLVLVFSQYFIRYRMNSKYGIFTIYFVTKKEKKKKKKKKKEDNLSYQLD